MPDIVFWLAAMCFCEARGEPEIAQLAVIQVALNRQEQDNMYMNDVLLSPRQFCVWELAKSDPRIQWHLDFVRKILTYKPVDMTNGAKYFTSTTTPPKTIKPLELVITWGNMRFWREI